MREHTLLLDKSTFQQLSRDEHVEVMRRYILNVPPILVVEILADLSKSFQNGVSPDAKVAEFARKFGGSGDPINVAWDELCTGSLAGERVEMRGRTLVGDFIEGREPSGERAILIKPGPFNRSLLRR